MKGFSNSISKQLMIFFGRLWFLIWKVWNHIIGQQLVPKLQSQAGQTIFDRCNGQILAIGLEKVPKIPPWSRRKRVKRGFSRVFPLSCFE